MPLPEPKIRPLRRVNAGAWRSRDKRWTLLRHQGDPHPQRWYAYLDDDRDSFYFEGARSQRELVRWLERDAAEAYADAANIDPKTKED